MNLEDMTLDQVRENIAIWQERKHKLERQAADMNAALQSIDTNIQSLGTREAQILYNRELEQLAVFAKGDCV